MNYIIPNCITELWNFPHEAKTESKNKAEAILFPGFLFSSI